MGKEGELSADVAKPKTPAAHAATDGADSTHADTPSDKPTKEDEAARLSQNIWFDNDVKTLLPKPSGDASSGDDSLPVIAKAKPVGASDQSTAEAGITLTPIQTLLVRGDAAPGAPAPAVPAGDAAGTPESQKVEPAKVVVAETPPGAEAVKPVPVTAPGDMPPNGTGEKVTTRSVEGDKLAAPPKKESEPITDADIEKLRKAVIDADLQGPTSLKSLLAGRAETLGLIGKYASVDMTDKTDESTKAVETLKAQEIQQVLKYSEYLAPGTTRTDLGTALISRGDDASIMEGEKLLVEAVQARPDLIFHPNFRAQVMDSYNKMAEFRKEHNLEPWKGEIPLPASTPAAPTDSAPWTDKTDEHFKAANDAYWNTGVKSALPEFQKAIESADETATHNQDRLAKERMELFVSGLKADRAIAQGQVTGESTTEMEKRRVDIWGKQVDNYVEDSVGSRARMNVGLAMIASGDPEMLAKGTQQLQDAVAKHPGLVFSPGLSDFGNQFTERLLGAYKANVENGGTAGKPDTTTGGNGVPSEYMPAGVEELQSGYKSPLPSSNADRKVEGYGWDKATDIGLPIASLALMFYTGRRQYNNFQRNRAAREASFALEAPDKGGTQSDVFTRKGDGGEERFEIKGRAKDGQVVAKNLAEGSDTSASSKPPLDPPKDFNPAKNKYGDYQPVAVDGKKYFLNKNGEAFEHKGGKLQPTDAIRGLKQTDVASLNLNPLPSDMQRTSFQNLGRELTPIGTLDDGRVVLQNSTTGSAPMRDWIKVPDNVDPFKGEFKDLQYKRLAGRDYFISPDSKVYTFLQPERTMMEVESVVVQPQDAVYKATGMPGSSAEERALNKKVNEILEPLRTRLRAGEEVDAATKSEIMDKAREALMPAAKEVAKSLGLPESVITNETFSFDQSDRLASHDPRSGRITLNIFGDSHLTSLDHEIKHKKQSLDKIAAADADPAGFRDAILESSINDIGKPGRRFTDNGIDSRPAIEDPIAREQMQKLVRDQVKRDYAERRVIPPSEAPPQLPNSAYPKELVAALGNVDAVKSEVMKEAQNFRTLEKENTIGRSELNEGSQKYVDQKVEEFKRWKAEHAGTADGGALKNNPEVKQMLDSVAIDTLGTNHRLDPSLRSHYRFSPAEIDARQNQVDAAVQRLTSELKAKGDTTALADHPEGKKLIERGKVIELQKQLLSDMQSGDVEEARAHAKELLQKMEAEPQVYTEDVRFMQQRGLLSPEQTKGTKFESLLREPLAAGERATTSSDMQIAALETPGFTSPGSGDAFKLDLARLDATRDAIRLGPAFKADVGQENVYNLLANPKPEQGILAKLKAEGKISADWDIFPTEPAPPSDKRGNSPADSVGADYLLVNRKTGDFFFLDATKNPTKDNVFKLREDGVILYKSEYFERGSGILEQPAKGELPNERESAALKFKEGLERQIYDMVQPVDSGQRKAAFNLKETPMPDVRVTSEEAKLAQVDRLIKWAGDQAKKNGETGAHEPYSDMARVLTNGVKEYLELKAVKAPSDEFEKSVRQRTQKEIAKFVAAKASNKNPADRSGAGPRTDTDVSARNDTIELVDGDKIHTTRTPMSKMLDQESRALLEDPIKIIKQLSKEEILGLDKVFSKPPFEGKSTDKLKLEIERAYKAEPRGPVGKVIERLTAALISNKGLIQAGGKEGTGPKVIERSVVDSLRTATTDSLVSRFQAVAAKAPKLEPGEAFAKQVPNASKDLRSGMAGLIEGRLGDTPNKDVSEWMQSMVKDAENKKTSWDDNEIAKFKELADKYKAGDADTVKQVNDWLDKAATDGAKPSELAGNTPVLEVPSPVGAEQLGHFKDLVESIKNLDGKQYFGEVTRTAKTAVASQISNRMNKLAFSETQMDISESSGLKPGESEMIIRRGNQVIKPTSFQGGNGVEPAYITADGTKIPASEVRVEIKIGAGSSKDQVAREGLIRSQQLAEIVAGKSPKGANAQAEVLAMRKAFDGKPSSDASTAHQVVADNVISLGQFEFQSKRMPVELTKTGVKIGDQKEISFEKLVQDTTRVKRAELERLEKEKQTSNDAELPGRIEMLRQQVADLEQLATQVRNPESVGKLMEAIRKQATPEEIAKLKAERERPGERFGKGTIGRIGAYSLVAAFVAASLAGSSSPGESIVPDYVPTKF